MLTAGIPTLYTAKIFRPQVRVGNNDFLDFNLAAIRRNGITANNILCVGDAFVELKIRGAQSDYFIPIDLWDFYQLLTQCGETIGPFYLKAKGTEILSRLQRVGVSLARYEAWRLTKKLPFWPKSELIPGCLTHRDLLLERASDLLNESFFKLRFSELSLNIPGGLAKATFRFSTDDMALGRRLSRDESGPAIKVDYELEPVSLATEELVLV